MKKMFGRPILIPETGEWKYRGKYYDYYPGKDYGQDEFDYEEYLEREREDINET